MKSEEEINQDLDEAMERYMNENRRMQNGSISEVDEARLEIIDLLSEHADGDGKISKRRIKAVLSDLEEVEEVIQDGLTASMEETVDKTTERAINASMAALGALATSGIISKRSIKETVRESVLKRIASDGVTLEDRIYRIAGGLIDEVRDTVRSGVLRGDSATAISRNVKKTFERDEWKIRRIIMTEGNNAYRETIGEVAIAGSSVIKAVQIKDNRGRHRNHESHECYRLAEQDMYGWGKGVYRPQDEFIYDPHPQCTAYFRFILADDLKRKGGGA